MLEKLKKLNPDLTFLTADDYSPLFKRVKIDTAHIVELSEKLTPSRDNFYIADDSEATALPETKLISDTVFGEVDLQFGWCFGGGKKMNGMEWHKSSEVNVACTDAVLLLGDYRDISNDRYDSKNAIALYLKKGDAVELYPLTLHLAPLAIKDAFIIGVILPKGTNYPLSYDVTGTLRMKNKWLIIHPENTRGIEQGSKLGVDGKNITLITE